MSDVALQKKFKKKNTKDLTEDSVIRLGKK